MGTFKTQYQSTLTPSPSPSAAIFLLARLGEERGDRKSYDLGRFAAFILLIPCFLCCHLKRVCLAVQAGQVPELQ